MPGGPAMGPEPPGKPTPPRSAARGGETPAWGQLAWLWQPKPWANAGGDVAVEGEGLRCPQVGWDGAGEA